MQLANAISTDEPIELVLDFEAVGNLTLRLAQLLAEEVDLLDSMKVQDIARLHEEKLALVHALEKQHRLIQQRPDMLIGMEPEDRERLEQVTAIFQHVLAENHRRLTIAREVNMAVVEAIKDTMHEHASRGIYSMRGRPQMSGETLSVSLNNLV